MNDLLGHIADWAIDVIYSFGYAGIAMLMLIENLFPPIPSELILPLSGFLIGQGRFNPLWTLLAATIGSLSGALVLYGLGRWLGEAQLRQLVRRYGTFLLLDESDLERGRDWFERHGGFAVLIGRCIPGIRSLISIPAGIESMSPFKFITYTVAGSAAWNSLLIGLGWVLGDQWQRLEQYVEIVQYLVLAAIALAVIWFIRHRLKQRTEDQHGET